MTLKELTLKLTMLLALVTAQRLQTLKAFAINHMQILPDGYVFRINSLLKQSSSKGYSNRHLSPVVLKEYTNDGKLCVVSLVKEYLRRTNVLRKGETQLLLCHTKPYGAASKDTIGRWIKTVMMKAGIDTSVFKPHATRSAATSAEKAAKVSIDQVMTTAGWHSSSIFGKYYDKPVVTNSAFTNSVLTGANKFC